jgi:photosystem II stability/assembly factor-like uncharacterized protein
MELLLAALLLLSFAQYCSSIALEWVQINVPESSSTSSFVSLTYSAEFNIVATAQSGTGSTIVRSVDNGLTWTSSTYTDGTFGFIYDITSKTVSGVTYFLGVDDTGVVYKSVDDGVTWTTVAVITSFSGLSVSIGSNGVAYIAGTSYKVFSSSEASGYATWTAKSPGGITPLSNFWDVSTYNGVNVIVVAGKGLIYYSSNSGTSWTKSTSGVPASTVVVYSVDHGSALTAMVSNSSILLPKRDSLSYSKLFSPFWLLRRPAGRQATSPSPTTAV